MSKIAALQLPTLSLSESRLDYYLNACAKANARLVVLGEYVLNSFFTELLTMPRSMIKEQSEAKLNSLIKFAKQYKLVIIAPYVEVGHKTYKKLCLKINEQGEISKYEQQILMPYSHWNEAKFFANKSSRFKLFHFEYEGIKCAVFFGFEAHFDAFWKSVRVKKIDLVLLPSACTFNSQQRWLELLKMRAFLNSTAILRINRIGELEYKEQEWKFYGESLYINAFGELEDTLSTNEEMLIIEPQTAENARKMWRFDSLNKRALQ